MEQTEPLKYRCKDCKGYYPRTAFYADAGRRGGVSNRCKSCERARGPARQRKLVDGRRGLIRRAKDRPCLDCGGNFPTCCMDFDHRGDEPKRFNLSSFARHSVAEILEEIDKCDVVCANCHRIRTVARMTLAGGEPPVEFGAST